MGYDEDNYLSPSPNTDSETYHYIKSFHHYTREALPRAEHYNHLEVNGPHRPSVSKLLATHYSRSDSHVQGDDDIPDDGGKVKFGWIRGVYIKVVLNIWGLILFLRLSWIVGQAGIGLGILIMTISNVVTVITTISMSAVSTNGAIRGGGIYYMISRSLGPEFGGSIGILFTISSCVSCGMLGIGFAESMLDLLKQCGYPEPIVDGDINDKRIIGIGILVLLLLLTFIGMETVAKTEMVLLVVLVAAQVDFVVGCAIGDQNDEEKEFGLTGFNADTLNQNWGPEFKEDNGKEQNFFTVFAVFFPAVTGIVAGANLSGDLKDPTTAIPKGTLLGVLTTFATYVAFSFVFGASVLRKGLYDQKAMNIASAFDGLIYAGCFAATTSSAIANIVGAPRVLQALAKDRIFPYIHVFEKSYGRSQDPLRGYVVCFAIALACVAIGDVNVVATISTAIYLASYGLVNFAVFHASITKSPGWRPGFKYYNSWVSLLGFLLCIAVMFLINWWLSLITISVVGLLFFVVMYLKPNVNWGSSTQAQAYVLALKGAQDLLGVDEHVKNYRPQVLILSGHPSSRPPLIDFGNLLTKNISLLVVGHVVKPPVAPSVRNTISRSGYSFLKKHHIRGFYSMMVNEDFEEGVSALCQVSGLGKLRPNMVLMGYKNDWRKCSRDEMQKYFLTLHDILQMHLAVSVLRVPEGFDYSNVINSDNNEEQLVSPKIVIEGDDSSSSDSDTSGSSTSIEQNNRQVENVVNVENEKPKKGKMFRKKKRGLSAFAPKYQGPGGTPLSKDILHNLTRFKRKQQDGFIDVWWLYDDGGLTLLLPYILTTRSQFKSCQLRIFSIAAKRDELEREQANLASLLSKFRIDYSDVTVIPDIGARAHPDSKKAFEKLISKYQSSTKDDECSITETELSALKEKTNRHLRLRELLDLHSKNSAMIVMTLPMPRKGTVSAPLYMAWLEMITKDMPPFLLVRGNQTSVLTCWS